MTNLTQNSLSLALTPAQKSILEAAAGRADGSIHPVPDYLKGGAAKKVIKVLKAHGLIDDADRITALGHNTIDPDWTSPTGDTPAGMEEESADEASTVQEASEANPAESDDALATDDDPANIPSANIPPLNEADQTKKAPTTGAGDAEQPPAATDDGETSEASNETIDEANDEADPGSFEEDVTTAEKILAEAKPRRTRENTKQAKVIEMLKRPEGATAAQIAEATGWANHTVRGFLSIAKKKLGLEISASRMRVVGPNQQGSPGSFTTYFAA
ncbi:MAG: DUF3489 domain-containing protein [Magnetococcus sp. XQGC-1]